MTIRNVIFDWDGTLAQTLDLWLDGYAISLEKRGLFLAAEQVVADFFQNHEEVPDKHPELDFAKVVHEAYEHVHDAVSNVSLYEAGAEIIHALRDQNTAISLVSSSTRRLLEAGLNTHNLEALFISILAGDDGFGRKPDPLPFEETLDRMGASATETLIIGDSAVDIQAGKALGCKTCLFAPSHNHSFHDMQHLKSLGADHEIEHLSKLADIV